MIWAIHCILAAVLALLMAMWTVTRRPGGFWCELLLRPVLFFGLVGVAMLFMVMAAFELHDALRQISTP